MIEFEARVPFQGGWAKGRVTLHKQFRSAHNDNGPWILDVVPEQGLAWAVQEVVEWGVNRPAMYAPVPDGYQMVSIASRRQHGLTVMNVFALTPADASKLHECWTPPGQPPDTNPLY